MRLIFAPLVLLWAFAGFCLGFGDIRDWLAFTLLAVCLAWYTAKWLHHRAQNLSMGTRKCGAASDASTLRDLADVSSRGTDRV